MQAQGTATYSQDVERKVEKFRRSLDDFELKTKTFLDDVSALKNNYNKTIDLLEKELNFWMNVGRGNSRP